MIINNNKKSKKLNIKLYVRLKKAKKIITIIGLILIIFLILQKKYFSYIINTTNRYYNKQLNFINKNICNRLVINGIKYSNYNKIQQHINNYCNIDNITMDELRNNILQDYWVKDIYIQKQFPNTLKVNIIEYNPFAILTKDNIYYELIDEYGNTINIPQEEISNFSYLLVVVGNDVKNEVNNIFNLLSIYYNITKELIKIERVGNRRWNLVLKNNIVVKMPEEGDNMFDAWSNLNKIINIHGLVVDLEEIDLRIKDKIYLKYKEKTAQEIKNMI